VHALRLAWFAATSKLRISPGAHSVMTSNGRQQVPQPIVNRWGAMMLSTTISQVWPQNGHWMDPDIPMRQFSRAAGKAKPASSNPTWRIRESK
jgi:hypothetical protein